MWDIIGISNIKRHLRGWEISSKFMAHARPHCSLCPRNRYVHFICATYFTLCTLVHFICASYFTLCAFVLVLLWFHTLLFCPRNRYVHFICPSYSTLGTYVHLICSSYFTLHFYTYTTIISYFTFMPLELICPSYTAPPNVTVRLNFVLHIVWNCFSS